MNNNQPNYYGHHISSINMSFSELDVRFTELETPIHLPGKSYRQS